MDWRILEAKVDGAVARVFGESVRLSFLKGGAVDPDRAVTNISAILHTGGDDSNNPGVGDNFRTRLSAGQAELFIDRATYAGPTPRVQDRVRANDRDGMPWFEVSAVSDRYTNLLVLSLNQA
jgi:hypothetical protein